jgi:hypothetical protein
MSNVFDQFDAAPPGVAPAEQPQTAPPGGNFFDRFDGGPGPEAPPPPEKPPRMLDTQIPLPTPGQVGGYISEKVQQAAPDLLRNYENTMLGAEQRTVPHPLRYGQPLSTQLEVNDAGEVSYRDDDGNLVPTDRSKHVILQGPAGMAVYARSPDTRESPIEGASRVLSLGMGANAPGSTARAVARTAPSTEAAIPKLREAAESVYRDPALRATPTNAQQVSDAFLEIAPQLQSFDPRVLQRLKGELSGIDATLGGLDHASSRLGVIAGETTGPLGNQTPTPAAAAATILKKQIDGLIRKMSPEWESADQNYAAMKAAQTIVGRGDLATVRARAGDFAEKMGQQATTLLANPQLTRGFRPEELDLLRAMSEGKLPGDKMRAAAEWMTRKLALLGPAAAGLIGYEHSGVLGALGGMAGTAALEGLIGRFLGGAGNRAATEQINTLVANIRARSPLAAQLKQNLADWETARSALMATPRTASLSGLAASSRELSKTLGALGVKIRPDALMRVEGPSDSQAGGNQ